jgi:cell division protein FtsB
LILISGIVVPTVRNKGYIYHSFIEEHRPLRRYNILFAVLAAVSILVLGCFVYYLQNQVETLSQETKSLSKEVDDTRQEFNDLNSSLQHSLTLRTFNFTIVMSDTTTSQQGINYSSWGESAVLENVTLVSAGGTANTLSLSDLIKGSRPLDVYDLGFPFGKRWISHGLENSSVMVDTYGYGFYGAAMNTTELAPYENQSGTIMVTYYTFTGQLDLLCPAFAENATFYFAERSSFPGESDWQAFNPGETPKAFYKVVPLPPP